MRTSKGKEFKANAINPDGHTLLLAPCPAHLKPVLKVAYYTGLRPGEILNLTRGQVDVKEGFSKLAPEHCTSNTGRLGSLHREPAAMFKAMPRGAWRL